MPAYLFDSSAIAKRYCPEVGSDRVEAILNDAENLSVISRLTLVELHSVFSMKVRRQEISAADFGLLRKRLLADGKQRIFRVAAVTSMTYRRAVRLLMDHALTDSLRTLDSLQLAMALELRDRGRLDHFVTADQNLAKTSQKVGLSVVNPEIV
ncbi:MAG: type II toxin-antitoxin system VapC family toxin [Planctomycetota bacterium]